MMSERVLAFLGPIKSQASKLPLVACPSNFSASFWLVVMLFLVQSNQFDVLSQWGSRIVLRIPLLLRPSG